MTDALLAKIFLFAMLPVTELRFAVPFGIHQGLNPVATYIASVAGNILPVIPVLLLLEKGTDYAMKFGFSRKLVERLFARTRKKGKLIEKYELLGLILFVAVPLPGTGAWSGCLAAHLFGLEKKRSFLAILLGVSIAGIIMVSLSLGLLGVIANVFK